MFSKKKGRSFGQRKKKEKGQGFEKKRSGVLYVEFKNRTTLITYL
jgi:hypothetical protein